MTAANRASTHLSIHRADSPRLLLGLADARRSIRDGDLLLWRRRGLISIAGRGEHSHAAKAAWWDDDLFVLEMLQWVGGRAVPLAARVRQAPGRIDVFRTNPDDRWPEYDAAAATRQMRKLVGLQYGYLNLARTALLHLPLIRALAKAETDDKANGRHPPFCSMACAMADRIGGGVDPVKHLADRLTEPADLARSPFYQYRFTLVP